MLRVLLWGGEIIGKLLAVAWWTQHPWSWIGWVFFLLPDLLVLYHVFVPSAQGLCRVFTRFETERPAVWLTIDDGPDARDTPQILDLLDRHGARATFFVVGERAAREPALTAEIERRGHEVAHHTQTHPAASFWCASPWRVARELDATLRVLKEAAIEPRWFRAPVGIKNLWLSRALARRRLHCVGWNVRSFDAGSSDPQAVATRVMSQVQPGSIVLMHEGPTVHEAVRVKAIELVLVALAERKIACVLPSLEQLR